MTEYTGTLFVDYVWAILTNPRDTEGLLHFYCAWIVMLMAFHLVLDFLHPDTPSLKINGLQSKISEVYSSATVASSILLICIMLRGFQSHPLFASDAMYLPLILSSFTGVLVGLSGLAPSAKSV
jgi:hypothetical protein